MHDCPDTSTSIPEPREGWSSCALGTPDIWPLELRAYTCTLSSFAYPAAIFWNHDLTLIYNESWKEAGGISEQGQPQRGSLTADAWNALNTALQGGCQRRVLGEELLRSGAAKEYIVLISPLFSGEKGEVAGLMAQLISDDDDSHSKNQGEIQDDEMEDVKPSTNPLPSLLSRTRTPKDDIPLNEHPFFHRFAEMLPAGLAILDHQAHSVFVNQHFYNLTTHQGDNKAFTAWPDSIHPDDQTRVLDAYQNAFRSQKQLRIEFRAQASTPAWRLLLLTPLGDENLKHVSLREYGGFVCCIVDITSEKGAELTQRGIAREARERKEQQERFIDMISHEIRNPMSAVMHCVEDIEDALRAPLTADSIAAIRESAETIDLCISHQRTIVDDVLSFSKLDSAMLTLLPRPCQPSRQLSGSLKMFHPEFRKQGISFTYTVDPSYAENDITWVLADYARIAQVLVNLISNSVKFTSRAAEPKNISVTVGAGSSRPAFYPLGVAFTGSHREYHMDTTNTPDWGDGDAAYLMFAVSDTGIGISQAGQERLFERFRQETPKTQESYGGSGLGLAICRKLCHLHGGEIGVMSEEGRGTTFGAFFRVRKIEPGRAMDGVETPGSAQTDSDRPDEIKMRALNDADPVDRVNDLVATDSAPLAEQTQTPPISTDTDETQPARGKSLPPRDPSRPLHLLLVEDNAINARLIERKLRSRGFLVQVASNGREAVDAVRMRYPQTNSSTALRFSEGTLRSSEVALPFDIILMDQEMPVMDGNAATRAIRKLSKEEGGGVPILGVSANVREEQQKTMLDAGMDGVVSKPYKIEEMMERIEGLLGRG